MALEIIEFQRPEERYNTVEALITQMREDIRIARKILT